MNSMRGNDDQKLDALFGAYRAACGGPEPSANFMPNLWARIESRQSVTFSFRRMANAFATAVLTTGNAGGPPPKRGPEEFRKKYTADLTRDVKLDGEQVKKLNGILDQTRAELEKVNQKSKPEWDALNKERDALREKWHPD